ncbi:MAG TPA: class I SAM-dependent methyltransferase [Phycisphaerae bacterium]|nr:class I SAM-dependent methyltransferase [Phycisphaerae bacterium]
MPAKDALTRFSTRVEDYIRYRPGYPPEVLESLTSEFGLRPTHVVADIGSGTGISAAMFLLNGNTVYGVEPNADMRAAAEKLLADYPAFHSVTARAAATTLLDACVDWVVAAQAFHWFDVDAARREFRRILRPGGRTVLMWNNRRPDTPFMREYEDFIHRFALDYNQINHENAETDGRIARFFGAGGFERRSFPNAQVFDFDGLRGRVLSSSYMPAAGHPSFEAMIPELRRLFDRHADGGRVQFDYDTKLWVGTSSPS